MMKTIQLCSIRDFFSAMRTSLHDLLLSNRNGAWSSTTSRPPRNREAFLVPYPQHPHDSKVTPPHTEFLMGSSQPNVRSIQPNRQTTFFFMGGVGIHVHPAFQNSRLTSFLLLSISGIFHAGKRGRPTLQMECSIVSRHFHCRVALPHGISILVSEKNLEPSSDE